MTELLTLTIDHRNVATLTLNRPAVHNAFNAELIAELSASFDRVVADGRRVLVLTGAGHSFSAGADLNWMRAMAGATAAENQADAARLAAMLRKLDELPCPTIARINGHAFGGGVGLVACCDMAVAHETAQFGLTEVRLGLAPATIAPFVIPKIGLKHARRFMLTGERMDAATAVRIGLVTATVPNGQLDGHVADMVDLLLAGGPQAQAQVKELIRLVSRHAGDSGTLDQQTSKAIAALRVSAEGQEGLTAFLDKRPPEWAPGKKEREKRGAG